jgi:hypothetical protein
MAMKRVLSSFGLSVLTVCLAMAPTGATASTVFWDGATIGGIPGYGVSQAMANAAGVPIRSAVGVGLLSLAASPEIADRTIDLSSVRLGPPATLTANWNVINDTGTSLQDLYLVFERPTPGTITLSGESETVTYAPDDVGLTLGSDWVIFRVDVNSIPVYYPAVSLGNLANGANVAFPLPHVLDNPQVFREPLNLELGMPKWTVFFVTVPEPASGVLVLFGLLAIAGGRHKRS